MDKVWHKTVIATEEQDVHIYPTEQWDGIIVETKEADGRESPRTYLNEAELDFLIDKMREMMEYVNTYKTK